MDLFSGVEDFEGEDGKTVDDEAGGLGVQRGGFVLRTGFEEQGDVGLLDEIVAALVESVDGVLDVGDGGVGGVGGTGVVFLVPEVEVGAVLVEDEVGEFGGEGRECLGAMPEGVGLVVEGEDGR